MSVSSKSPLSRDRAWSCIMMNVATPGTGSMRAGRVFTGVCQLLFAVVGAALICIWMIKTTYTVIQNQISGTAALHASGWLWKWGVVGFAVSWSWTFITCVDLFRRAKADERKAHENIPPRLTDLPGQPPKLS